MQRRAFLSGIGFGVLTVPSSTQAAPCLDMNAPFNTMGLKPAEFKRQWVEAARALRARKDARELVWHYAPTGEIEPFLAWYPGDEFVDRWHVSRTAPLSMDAAMVRSFAHEAALRRKPVTGA